MTFSTYTKLHIVFVIIAITSAFVLQIEDTSGVNAREVKRITVSPDAAGETSLFPEDSGESTAPTQDHGGAWQVSMTGGVLRGHCLIQRDCDDVE